MPEFAWATRRPTLADVPAILAVVHASDIASIGEPDFSAQDVRAALTAPNSDPTRDSWLAVDGSGEVLGWAYVDNPSGGQRDFVEVYVLPDRGEPVRRPLLDLLVARVAQRATGFGFATMTARAGAVPTETAWVAALRAAGFDFVKRYARMSRPLHDVAPTAPTPPDGVVLRPVRADDAADLRRFHQVVETAFVDSLDHQPTGYDDWLATAMPDRTGDEWFVAEVDGQVAGVLQSADQSLDQNEGWVKALAVLAEYRSRGVGTALLRRAFAAYAAKGRTSAGLGVDLANPTRPARLYRAVGLTPRYEADIYQREVAAA